MLDDLMTPKFLRHPTAFMLFGATAAFCTYACMYAFRKGITAVRLRVWSLRVSATKRGL
jgi:hypothetical protein